MNPNSQNQRWSLWEYRIYPDGTKRPSYSLVKKNSARFGRLLFGSASEMRIVCATDDYGRLYWEIAILTEGHPVHESAYVNWIHRQWAKFFRRGFGQTCEIHNHARLEAGDRQDGRPADQLIMLPSLPLEGAI
jgi:hypothetical protein